MSLREAILAKKDVIVEKLAVPEWAPEAGEVYIRTISGFERDRFEESIRPKSGQAPLANFRARFAVLVICDAEGKREFTDADAVELGKKSQAALDRILAAGLKLNGMSEKDVDDLEKKSETDQSAASGSA